MYEMERILEKIHEVYLSNDEEMLVKAYNFARKRMQIKSAPLVSRTLSTLARLLTS